MDGLLITFAVVGAAAVAGRTVTGSRSVESLERKLETLRHQRDKNDDPDWREYIDGKIERVQLRLEAERSRLSPDQSRELARGHAERLRGLIVSRKGAPRMVRVWSKPGVGVRVYFPAELGYVSVGWDGTVTGYMGNPGGALTLYESSMYPSWRKAWRAALEDYLRE